MANRADICLMTCCGMNEILFYCVRVEMKTEVKEHKLCKVMKKGPEIVEESIGMEDKAINTVISRNT